MATATDQLKQDLDAAIQSNQEIGEKGREGIKDRKVIEQADLSGGFLSDVKNVAKASLQTAKNTVDLGIDVVGEGGKILQENVGDLRRQVGEFRRDKENNNLVERGAALAAQGVLLVPEAAGLVAEGISNASEYAQNSVDRVGGLRGVADIYRESEGLKDFGGDLFDQALPGENRTQKIAGLAFAGLDAPLGLGFGKGLAKGVTSALGKEAVEQGVKEAAEQGVKQAVKKGAKQADTVLDDIAGGVSKATDDALESAKNVTKQIDEVGEQGLKSTGTSSVVKSADDAFTRAKDASKPPSGGLFGSNLAADKVGDGLLAKGARLISDSYTYFDPLAKYAGRAIGGLASNTIGAPLKLAGKTADYLGYNRAGSLMKNGANNIGGVAEFVGQFAFSPGAATGFSESIVNSATEFRIDESRAEFDRKYGTNTTKDDFAFFRSEVEELNDRYASSISESAKNQNKKILSDYINSYVSQRGGKSKAISNLRDLRETTQDIAGLTTPHKALLTTAGLYDKLVTRRNIYQNVIFPGYAEDQVKVKDQNYEQLKTALGDRYDLSEEEIQKFVDAKDGSTELSEAEEVFKEKILDDFEKQLEAEAGLGANPQVRKQLRETAEERLNEIKVAFGEVEEAEQLGLEFGQKYITKGNKERIGKVGAKKGVDRVTSLFGNNIRRIEQDIERLEGLETPQAAMAAESNRELVGIYTNVMNQRIEAVIQNNGVVPDGIDLIGINLIDEYRDVQSNNLIATGELGGIGVGTIDKFQRPLFDFIRGWARDKDIYSTNRLSLENKDFSETIMTDLLDNGESISYLVMGSVLNKALGVVGPKAQLSLGKGLQRGAVAGSLKALGEGTEELLQELSISSVTGQPLTAQSMWETALIGGTLATSAAVSTMNNHRSLDLADNTSTVFNNFIAGTAQEFGRELGPQFQAMSREQKITTIENTVALLVELQEKNPELGLAVNKAGHLQGALKKSFDVVLNTQAEDIKESLRNGNANGVLTQESYNSFFDKNGNLKRQRRGNREVLAGRPVYTPEYKSNLDQRIQQGKAEVEAFMERIPETRTEAGQAIVTQINRGRIDGGRAELTINGKGQIVEGSRRARLRDVLPEKVLVGDGQGGRVEKKIEDLTSEQLIRQIRLSKLPDKVKQKYNSQIVNSQSTLGANVKGFATSFATADVYNMFRRTTKSIVDGLTKVGGKKRENKNILDQKLGTIFDDIDVILDYEGKKVDNIIDHLDQDFGSHLDITHQDSLLPKVDLSQIPTGDSNSIYIEGTTIPRAITNENIESVVPVREGETEQQYNRRVQQLRENIESANEQIMFYNQALAYQDSDGTFFGKSHTAAQVYKRTLKDTYGLNADEFLYETYFSDSGEIIRNDSGFIIFKITGDIDLDEPLTSLMSKAAYTSLISAKGKKVNESLLGAYTAALESKGIDPENDPYFKIFTTTEGIPPYRNGKLNSMQYAYYTMLKDEYPDTESLERFYAREVPVNIGKSLFDSKMPKADDGLADTVKYWKDENKRLELVRKISTQLLRDPYGPTLDALGLNTRIRDKDVVKLESARAKAILGLSMKDNKALQGDILNLNVEDLKIYNRNHTSPTIRKNAVQQYAGYISLLGLNMDATTIYNQVELGRSRRNLIISEVGTIDTKGMNILGIDDTIAKYSSTGTGRLSIKEENLALVTDRKKLKEEQRRIKAGEEPSTEALPDPDYILSRLATLDFDKRSSQVLYYGSPGVSMLAEMSPRFKAEFQTKANVEGAKKTKQELTKEAKELIVKDIMNQNPKDVSSPFAKRFFDLNFVNYTGESLDTTMEIFYDNAIRAFGLNDLDFDYRDANFGKFNGHVMSSLYKLAKLTGTNKTPTNLRKALVKKYKTDVFKMNKDIQAAIVKGKDTYKAKEREALLEAIEGSAERGDKAKVKKLKKLNEDIQKINDQIEVLDNTVIDNQEKLKEDILAEDIKLDKILSEASEEIEKAGLKKGKTDEEKKIIDEVRSKFGKQKKDARKARNEAVAKIREDAKKEKSEKRGDLDSERTKLKETRKSKEKEIREITEEIDTVVQNRNDAGLKLEQFDIESTLFHEGKKGFNLEKLTGETPDGRVPVYEIKNNRNLAGNTKLLYRSSKGGKIIYAPIGYFRKPYSKLDKKYREEFYSFSGKTLEYGIPTKLEQYIASSDKPHDVDISGALMESRLLENQKIDDLDGQYWNFVANLIPDIDSAKLISSFIPTPNLDIDSLRSVLEQVKTYPGVRTQILNYANRKKAGEVAENNSRYISIGLNIETDVQEADIDEALDILAEDLHIGSSFETPYLDSVANRIDNMETQEDKVVSLEAIAQINELTAQELATRVDGIEYVGNPTDILDTMTQEDFYELQKNHRIDEQIKEYGAYEAVIDQMTRTADGDIIKGIQPLRRLWSWYGAKAGAKFTINRFSSEEKNMFEWMRELSGNMTNRFGQGIVGNFIDEKKINQLMRDVKASLDSGVQPKDRNAQIMISVMNHLQKGLGDAGLPEAINEMILNIPQNLFFLKNIDNTGAQIPEKKKFKLHGRRLLSVMHTMSGKGDPIKMLGALNPTDYVRFLNTTKGSGTTEIPVGRTGTTTRVSSSKDKFLAIFADGVEVASDDQIASFLQRRLYNDHEFETDLMYLMSNTNDLVPGLYSVGKSMFRSAIGVMGVKYEKGKYQLSSLSEMIPTITSSQRNLKMLVSYGFSFYNSATALAAQITASILRYDSYRNQIPQKMSLKDIDAIRESTGLNRDFFDIPEQASQGVQNAIIDILFKSQFADILIDKFFVERGLEMSDVVGTDGKITEAYAQEINSYIRGSFSSMFGSDIDGKLNSRNAGPVRTLLNPHGTWAANMTRSVVSNIGSLGSQYRYVNDLETGGLDAAQSGLYNNYENTLFLNSVLRSIIYSRRLCELSDAIANSTFGYSEDVNQELIDLTVCGQELFNIQGGPVPTLITDAISSSPSFRVLRDTLEALMTDYSGEEHGALSRTLINIFQTYGKAQETNFWIYNSFLDGMGQAMQEEDAERWEIMKKTLADDFEWKSQSLNTILMSDIEAGIKSGRPILRGARSVFKGSDYYKSMQYDFNFRTEKELRSFFMEGADGGPNKRQRAGFFAYNVPVVRQIYQMLTGAETNFFRDANDPEILYDHILTSKELGYNQLVSGQFAPGTQEDEYQYAYGIMRSIGPGWIVKNEDGEYDFSSQSDFTEEGERTLYNNKRGVVELTNKGLRDLRGDEEYTKFIKKNLDIDWEKPRDQQKARVYTDALVKYDEGVAGSGIVLLGSLVAHYEEERAKALGYKGTWQEEYRDSDDQRRIQAEIGKEFGEFMYDTDPGLRQDFMQFSLGARIEEQIATGAVSDERAEDLKVFLKQIDPEKTGLSQDRLEGSVIDRAMYHDILIDKYHETGDYDLAEGLATSLANLPNIKVYDNRLFDENTDKETKSKLREQYNKSNQAWAVWSLGYTNDRLKEQAVPEQRRVGFLAAVVSKNSDMFAKALADPDVIAILGKEKANYIANIIFENAEDASWALEGKNHLERAIGKLGSGKSKGKGGGRGRGRRSSRRSNRRGRRRSGGNGKYSGVAAHSSKYSDTPLEDYKNIKSNLPKIKKLAKTLFKNYKPTTKAKFPKFDYNYNEKQFKRLYARARYESLQSEKLTNRLLTSQKPKFKVKVRDPNKVNKKNLIKTPDPLSGREEIGFEPIA